jgi:exonuclease SbcD
MKFIHTADWHLGQKLIHQYRTEEHDAFLNFLFEQIKVEKSELLIIAGDVFDNGNPPRFAEKQYFDFLTKLLDTECNNVVIVGGNHDSAVSLNSAKQLLRALNIHVVGGISENPEEDIIPVVNRNKETVAVVCAIPFLRERDLRLYADNEDEENRQKLLNGVSDYYKKMAEKALPYKNKGIPLIATGHLFLTDSEKSEEGEESEREIYVGNLANIEASLIPKEFDYVALGHIHKAQKIGSHAHIRYSGSPIPLSFSERNYRHVILSVEILPENSPVVVPIDVPLFRRLVRFEGTIEQIKNKIAKFENDENTAWAECIWEGEDSTYEGIMSALEKRIEECGKNIEIFKVERKKTHNRNESDDDFFSEDLSILDSPMTVFETFLRSKKYPEEDKDLLKEAFRELLGEIGQSDD